MSLPLRPAPRRILPLALLVVSALLAAPAGAQVSGAVALDAVETAMRARGLTPPPGSALRLRDYIETDVDAATEREAPRGSDTSEGVRRVRLWIGPDGRVLPTPEWRSFHPDHCKEQARYMESSAWLLNLKIFAEDLGTHNVAAQVIDVKTGVIQAQQMSGWTEGVAGAVNAAWDALGAEVGAPGDPCGEVRLEHVAGEKVGDEYVFRAGFLGTASTSSTRGRSGTGSRRRAGRSSARSTRTRPRGRTT